MLQIKGGKKMEKIVGEGKGFERIRRVTGYLAGDVSRFNNGKRAEEKDRGHKVVHIIVRVVIIHQHMIFLQDI